MAKRVLKQQVDNETTKRHYIRVGALVVFVGGLITLLITEVYPHVREYRVEEVSAPVPVEVIDVMAQPVISYAYAEPTLLRIPSADIESSFEGPLGLNADQTIGVPVSFEQVGWYSYGKTPGELGTSVILGHVDSYRGPAVLYNLKDVVIGDRIFVDRSDGTTVEFEVTDIARYDQDAFPNELVYAQTSYPSLRVITCTGRYDKGIKRYSHNLVVYAKLVTEETDVATTTNQIEHE